MVSKRTASPGRSTSPDRLAPASVVLRAVTGGACFGGSQVFAQALNILGVLVLARLLPPAEFGLFVIFSFFSSVLLAFGDAGLGVSLTRKPQPPAACEYRTVFTAQLVFAVIIAAIFWAASGQFARYYDLPADHVWLFRVVAISYVVLAFQSIPIARMERQMQFERLGAIEVAKAITFNSLLVYLVWQGNGILSFVVADLFRSLAGGALANALHPWRPGVHWEWPLLKQHLSFSLPYQGIKFIAVVRSGITPVFIGLALGRAPVGYIDWALRMASFALIGVVAIERLFVPSFARLQAHPAALARFVERSLWAANGIVAPIAVLTLTLIGPITRIFFGEQWLDALPLFYVFWLGNCFTPTVIPLMALLHALGHARIGLAFSVAWMIATWLLGVPLALLYGTLGFVVGVTAVHVSSVLLFRVAQTFLRFDIGKHIVPVWIWAFAVGIGVAWFESRFPAHDWPRLVAYAMAGLSLYAAGIGLSNRTRIGAVLRS